jgi:hypothetical protein
MLPFWPLRPYSCFLVQAVNSLTTTTTTTPCNPCDIPPTPHLTLNFTHTHIHTYARTHTHTNTYTHIHTHTLTHTSRTLFSQATWRRRQDRTSSPLKCPLPSTPRMHRHVFLMGRTRDGQCSDKVFCPQHIATPKLSDNICCSKTTLQARASGHTLTCQQRI